MAVSCNPIYIVGATCTGKTRLSLALAERFGGEIISADSVQFYRGLDIGTAKPTPDELRQVPHHMINVSVLGETLTAGDYEKRVSNLLAGHPEKQFWIVGGSGFYISAVQNGMFDIEKIQPEIRLHWRQRLTVDGLATLFNELKQIDPKYAEQISANDTYRVMRGLEIYTQHQKPLSQIRSEFTIQNPKGKALKIGVHRERDELRKLVRERAQAMLGQGWIDETQALLNQGLEDWPPLNSVGYKEVKAYLKGTISREELEDQIVASTMKLAKKQTTWFRRDQEIRWFKPDDPEIMVFVEQSLAR